MAEYYRQPGPFPSVPSGHGIYGATTSTSESQPAHEDQLDDGQPRQCSVRGCGSILTSGYARKMCESCRSRHRTYASTKRAKRKLEKAALGAQQGQPIVWMPPDDTVSSSHSLIGQRALRAAIDVSASLSPEGYGFPIPWDESTLDPALMGSEFSHGPDPTQISHDTELAQALVLPTSNQSHRRGQQDAAPASDDPDDPLDLDNVSSPPRYCSIKGCRAIVSGNSFFKMCQECRDRYRSYGTTKRAKWRRDKQAAAAELQKQHGEEDRRRAEAGLPPLVRSPMPDWQEWQPESTLRPKPGVLPRMCTVSHCREVLPGDYQYLRCERHRIQNRHHSKLKRVRDKEVKAQAFDGWAAVVSARAVSEMSREATEEVLAADADSSREHRDADGNTGEPHSSGLGVADGIPSHLVASADGANVSATSTSGVGGPETPFGEPSTGIPPAARGTRRTNHVCSIKYCCNLLAPTNPWKMCDSCRARDRAIRRQKTVRGNAVVIKPLLKDPRPSKAKSKNIDATGSTSKPKKKKKKKTVTVESADNIASEASQQAAGPSPKLNSLTSPTVAGRSSEDAEHALGSGTTGPSQAAQPGVVFMEPLLPSSDSNMSTSEENDASSDPFHLVSAEQITSKGVHSAARAPASKTSGRRKKAAEATADPESTSSDVSQGAHSTVESTLVPGAPSSSLPIDPSASTAVSSPAVTSSAMAAPSTIPPPSVSPNPVIGPPTGEAPPTEPAPMQPYMPYYMHSYGMTPYGAQAPPYPYGAYPYARPPYGANQMYQPPYSIYPQPFTYSHSYPAQYASPPPVHPGAQPVYTISSDFVSRPEYSAASQSIQQSLLVSGGSASAAGSTFYSAFSARTGEPHVRASSNISLRRKRRSESENEASTSGTSKRQAIDVSHTANEVTSTPSAAPASYEATASSATQSVAPTIPSEGQDEPPSLPPVPPAVCSNRSCHRLLSDNASGTICQHCRERLKKRQAKAKQRFKLEPRRLLVGKSAAGHSTVIDSSAESREPASSPER